MCKILNMIANNISKKPVANCWATKSVNLYFEDSIDKKFKVLNLQHLSLVDFFITEELSSDSKNVFILKCNMIYENTINYAEEKDAIVLATFSSRKDADEALKKVRVAITKPNKILYKFGAFVLVSLVIATLGLNIFYTIHDNKMIDNIQKQSAVNGQNGDGSQAQLQPLPQMQMGGGVPMTMEQIQEMTKQIQKQVEEEANREIQANIEKFRAIQMGEMGDQQAQQPQQQVQQPPNPADSLLDKLQ